MFKLYFLLPVIVILAFLRPKLGERWFARASHILNRLSLGTGRSVAIVGLLSFSLCAGIGSFSPAPPPQIADEFGYLLLSDTFLHGRLTNPPHPMWQHFESIHIIQQPTYAAKYPPAQGLALALGTLLTGRPIVGVWLSTALACATICWMLFAWLPRRWAFVGGLLVALHPLMLTWSQSYWGGAVAMGGGALLSGAFRRLVDCRRTSDSVLMGLGIAILANSRPYEGFVLTSLMLAALFRWIFSPQGPALAFTIRRIVLPLGIIAVLLILQLSYYNYRVTGNALKMPYIVHEETYGVAPLFLWQQPRTEPVYRHKVIRDLQVNAYLTYYKQQRTLVGFGRAIVDKSYRLVQSYFWSLLLVIPLLGTGAALRYDTWVRFALVIGSLFSIAMLFGTWLFPHYAAPVFDLFMIVVVQSLRQVRLWRRDHRTGLALIRGTLILCVATVPIIGMRLAARDETKWDYQRMRLIEQLQQAPGEHLIIVRYSPTHNPNREWVYNSADLDTAKVLLARDMGVLKNQELLDYYPNRKVWTINADDPSPILQPYSSN